VIIIQKQWDDGLRLAAVVALQKGKKGVHEEGNILDLAVRE
jgi:hypothetical protein